MESDSSASNEISAISGPVVQGSQGPEIHPSDAFLLDPALFSNLQDFAFTARQKTLLADFISGHSALVAAYENGQLPRKDSSEFAELRGFYETLKEAQFEGSKANPVPVDVVPQADKLLSYLRTFVEIPEAEMLKLRDNFAEMFPSVAAKIRERQASQPLSLDEDELNMFHNLRLCSQAKIPPETLCLLIPPLAEGENFFDLNTFLALNASKSTFPLLAEFLRKNAPQAMNVMFGCDLNDADAAIVRAFLADFKRQSQPQLTAAELRLLKRRSMASASASQPQTSVTTPLEAETVPVSQVISAPLGKVPDSILQTASISAPVPIIPVSAPPMASASASQAQASTTLEAETAGFQGIPVQQGSVVEPVFQISAPAPIEPVTSPPATQTIAASASATPLSPAKKPGAAVITISPSSLSKKSSEKVRKSQGNTIDKLKEDYAEYAYFIDRWLKARPEILVPLDLNLPLSSLELARFERLSRRLEIAKMRAEDAEDLQIETAKPKLAPTHFDDLWKEFEDNPAALAVLDEFCEKFPDIYALVAEDKLIDRGQYKDVEKLTRECLAFTAGSASVEETPEATRKEASASSSAATKAVPTSEKPKVVIKAEPIEARPASSHSRHGSVGMDLSEDSGAETVPSKDGSSLTKKPSVAVPAKASGAAKKSTATISEKDRDRQIEDLILADDPEVHKKLHVSNLLASADRDLMLEIFGRENLKDTILLVDEVRNDGSQRAVLTFNSPEQARQGCEDFNDFTLDDGAHQRKMQIVPFIDHLRKVYRAFETANSATTSGDAIGKSGEALREVKKEITHVTCNGHATETGQSGEPGADYMPVPWSRGNRHKKDRIQVMGLMGVGALLAGLTPASFDEPPRKRGRSPASGRNGGHVTSGASRDPRGSSHGSSSNFHGRSDRVEKDNSSARTIVPPVTTVFVGNINPKTTNALLLTLFKGCGDVIHLRRIPDSSGKPLTFGYCEFGQPEGTLRAIRVLNDFPLGAKRLIVKVDDKVKRVLLDYLNAEHQRLGKGSVDVNGELPPPDEQALAEDEVRRKELKELVAKHAEALKISPGEEAAYEQRARSDRVQIEDADQQERVVREISQFREANKQKEKAQQDARAGSKVQQQAKSLREDRSVDRRSSDVGRGRSPPSRYRRSRSRSRRSRSRDRRSRSRDRPGGRRGDTFRAGGARDRRRSPKSPPARSRRTESSRHDDAKSSRQRARRSDSDSPEVVFVGDSSSAAAKAGSSKVVTAAEPAVEPTPPQDPAAMMQSMIDGAQMMMLMQNMMSLFPPQMQQQMMGDNIQGSSGFLPGGTTAPSMPMMTGQTGVDPRWRPVGGPPAPSVSQGGSSTIDPQTAQLHQMLSQLHRLSSPPRSTGPRPGMFR